MKDGEAPPQVERARWLMLIHQLPPKPAYLRVKIWRRLQALGAITVKNSVYVLPASEGAQEDCEWLLKEIADGGGEGLICEARLVDGLSDDDVRALFNAARTQDYQELSKEARALAAVIDAGGATPSDSEARGKLARLRAELSRVASIDFFGADGRETIEGLVAGLEPRLREETSMAEPTEVTTASDTLKGRVWVTRKGVHIDRIASAWLIRRFIDPEARFKFVPAKGYEPKPGELRFDMYEGEFTHEGDRCTFEVLRARLPDPADPALQVIGEIVHDIDLKDDKFGREEASGIGRVVDGIAASTKEDTKRLEQGAAVFDGLYKAFRTKRR